MLAKLNSCFEKSDGILITSPHNMQYFSGFSGGEGALFVSPQRAVLFTDSRYTEQAQSECKKAEVVEAANWKSAVCIEATGLKSLMFEDKHISAATYLHLAEKLSANLVPSEELLEDMRTVKTQAEIETMAKAEAILCRTFEKMLDFIKPGITEKQLAAEIEYNMRTMGADGTSFETIAISGVRTSLPHGTPTDKVIEAGDFVTMDFGCKLGGYCSDMTRTIVVGKATQKQREVYETVKEAQTVGLDAIKAGVCAKDADAAARQVIEKAGYGEYFRHSLGHGVGLLVHEKPTLSPKSNQFLPENAVVTCEPGIYIPGFGGVRIEDMVCVKKDGNLNLANATKELIEV